MMFTLKRFAFATIACAATSMLAGCPSASLSCTESVQWGQPVKKPGTAQVVADVTTLVPSIGVTGVLFSPGGLSGGVDVSQFAIDTAGSSFAWPSTGVVVLTISNASTGAMIATQSFNFSVSGTEVVFSNPASVDSWITSTGANPSTSEVTYAVQPFEVAAAPGTNTGQAAAKISGVTISTSSITFQGSSCNTKIHTPGICDPN